MRVQLQASEQLPGLRNKHGHCEQEPSGQPSSLQPQGSQTHRAQKPLGAPNLNPAGQKEGKVEARELSQSVSQDMESKSNSTSKPVLGEQQQTTEPVPGTCECEFYAPTLTLTWILGGQAGVCIQVS